MMPSCYKYEFMDDFLLLWDFYYFSSLSKIWSIFMLMVIATSSAFFVASTSSSIMYQPDSCAAPACNNDTIYCPGRVVCAPQPPNWMSTAEMIGVAIFTFEYLSRMLTIGFVPARIAGLIEDIEEDDDSAPLEFVKDDAEKTHELFDHLLVDLDGENTESVAGSAVKSLQASRVPRKSIMIRSVQEISDPAIAAEIEMISPSNKANLSINNEESGQVDEDLLWWWKIFLYGTSAMNVIDILAIIPFYIQLMTSAGASFSFVRILRLARVLRVFKFGKSMKGITLLSRTISKSVVSLAFVAFFITLGIILFGSIQYFVEGGNFEVTTDYPNGAYIVTSPSGKVPSNFRSIPTALYWAVVTSVTIGYGDIVPYTGLGRLVAVLCMYFGVLLLALPITVIGSNFNREYESYQGNDRQEFIFENLVKLMNIIDEDTKLLSLNPSHVIDGERKALVLTSITSCLDDVMSERLLLKLKEIVSKKASQFRFNEKHTKASSLLREVEKLNDIALDLEKSLLLRKKKSSNNDNDNNDNDKMMKKKKKAQKSSHSTTKKNEGISLTQDTEFSLDSSPPSIPEDDVNDRLLPSNVQESNKVPENLSSLHLLPTEEIALPDEEHDKEVWSKFLTPSKWF